ncbi:MAG: RlmE family RNA methyltransferase [Gammaproteobacteria bacterium]
MKRRSKTSQWHRRHVGDPWVKQAQQAGYRSRAAYKLLEIHQSERLIKRGQAVVDLGAAPGGWSQVAAEVLRGEGVVVGVDLLPVDPLPGVAFVQGDFCEDEVRARVLAATERSHVDVVLSDMAPDLTGVRSTDQVRSIALAEQVLAFARCALNPQGVLLMKVFQGEGFDGLFADFKASFSRVKTKKPVASRDRSRETYLLGGGLRT